MKISKKIVLNIIGLILLTNLVAIFIISNSTPKIFWDYLYKEKNKEIVTIKNSIIKNLKPNNTFDPKYIEHLQRHADVQNLFIEVRNKNKIMEESKELQGLYTQKEFDKDADNNCYIVKGDKLMNPAKLLEETATEFVGSKPFRAYMVDNSSAPAAGARMFSISVGGSTTAIEQLESTADSKAEYYDLQGRRLQDLQKGINIVKRGGKTMKVIIK